MVALVSTVYNEENSIKKLTTGLNSQTLRPDEIIIVDAGSTDNTVPLLKSGLDPKAQVLIKPGVGRSEGRNIAISSASSDVIVACDAGTSINNIFVESLSKPVSEGSTDVACGFFKPETTNFFEKCLAAATIPTLDEIEEEKFLPSSRAVAFKKSSWSNVVGYPEWLSVCEDLIFDLKLKKSGFRFKFVPEAIAYWKPRENLRAFFKQYFSYARGDGHAKLWLVRHVIRYFAYFTGLLILYLSLSVSLLWLLPFFAAQLGYFSKFFYRFTGHFESEDEFEVLKAFPAISFLVVVGDLAKMVGYPIGVYERVTNKVKFEPW